MTDRGPDDSSLHRVASTDGLDPGESSVVAVGDAQVALFNLDGDYYALENVCPHQDFEGPMAVDNVEGLSAEQNGKIFEDNARELFGL